MLLPKVRNQLLIGLSLTLLMIVTRGFHAILPFHLLDASWAVFFLAGVYLSARWVFVALCVVATVIDWIAISWGGVSSFCVTPAYSMLLPAYASLWLGGRWYIQRHGDSIESIFLLGVSVMVSAVFAELFSSGGFYFLGGRFADTTVFEFIGRLYRYYPQSLVALVLYVGLAALLQGSIVFIQHSTPDRLSTLKQDAYK